MNTKVMKWGNSLAVRIPKSFAKAININEGNDIIMKMEKNRIVVEKEKAHKYDLKSMLGKINKGNVHNEINSGEKTGKEIW